MRTKPAPNLGESQALCQVVACTSTRLEDEEVLIGQDRRLGDQLVTGRAHFVDELLARQLMVGRGPDRQIALVPVDDGHATVRRESAPEPLEVGDTSVDVMVGVNDQDEVAPPGGQARVVRRPEYRDDVGSPLLFGALAQVGNEVRLGVDGEHGPSLAYHRRQVAAEVAGSGAEIGNPHPRAKLERRHQLHRLLPLITFGVVEDTLPMLNVCEGVAGNGGVGAQARAVMCRVGRIVPMHRATRRGEQGRCGNQRPGKQGEAAHAPGIDNTLKDGNGATQRRNTSLASRLHSRYVLGFMGMTGGMAKVVLYTTQYCPYCVQAKALLKRKGVPFEEIDVGNDDVLRERMVKAAGGRRTVPQIFINDAPVGGFEELRALDEQGELDRLLAA